MKINLPAFSITLGLFWGGAILTTVATSFIWPNYGHAFLELVASVYPGYSSTPSVGHMVIGTLYGLADGMLSGLILAFVYNRITGGPAAA